MTSRKKPAKKSNQNQNQKPSQNSQQQPSKFGIQHFFDRHSLSQQNNLKPDSPAPSSASQNPQVPSSLQKCDPIGSGNGPTLGSVDPNEAKDAKATHSQNTPDENLIPVLENQLDVTPEICKSVAVKRFKFSPGMVIKQSQDDGGDAVTWRISPVNERLHAVSKHLPDVIRVLADSSRVNSTSFKQCSHNKSSTGSVPKLDKGLPSPPVKAAGKSLMLSNGTSSETDKPVCAIDLHGSSGNATNKTSSRIVESQSPFSTPPSLSYCHDKIHFQLPAPIGLGLKPVDDAVDPNVVSDQLGSRQHKKALLDLLDQVEDVISVEELACKDTKVLLSKYHHRLGDDNCVKSNPSIKQLEMQPAEKQPVDSAVSQFPFKVLHLLNEESGEERAVHLFDEWFLSVIAPGDTVHVVGEFDKQGQCVVSHGSNYLIVHPDILVSGTRVSSSFSCPRRTVLDERLKGGEHSATALFGTLLHEIFQAGLIRELPTKEFLEEYARQLLQKHIEGLYACGVNEDDAHKTLIEKIPSLLSWILFFRDSQGSRTPNVDFGPGHGLKEVKVSEVVDIEEMAWAPKYGLKGMIDASIRVKVSSANETHELIMPLEFKSGKATSGQAASEYRAQVMLYTLLMSERYQKRVDSGLLYYLHTDQTQGVVARRPDLVGLIMRRNALANDILEASMTQ